jgi:hypothetical protein
MCHSDIENIVWGKGLGFAEKEKMLRGVMLLTYPIVTT